MNVWLQRRFGQSKKWQSIFVVAIDKPACAKKQGQLRLFAGQRQ